MKIEIKHTMTVLASDEGMVITNKERTLFAERLWLGIYDDVANYEEITNEEAQALRKKQREEEQEQITE